MRKLAALTILIALASSACWPLTEWTTRSGETPQPPTTEQVVPGPAWVDDVEFIFLESWPVQVRAIVRGTLPSPCDTVVWDVRQTSAGAEVTISSAGAADEVCIAVLEPFEVIVDVGDYTSGTYSVIINGEAHEFTI